MRRHSIIPKHHLILGPPDTHLEIRPLCDLLEQKREDGVRFGFGDSDNLASESWVDVDRFPARDRVDSYDRVNGFDFLAADMGASCAGALGLSDSAVDGA